MVTAHDFARIRHQLGLTQQEMAEILNVSTYRIVQSWERGRRVPSGTVLMVYEQIASGWRPPTLIRILSQRKANP